MLDSAIQAVIQPILVAGLAVRGITAGVIQNNQPRQFVAPSTPTVFHTMGTPKPYGWPVAKDVVNVDGTITTTTEQVIHSRFQIAGCVSNASPAAPTALTSGDLARAAASIMQHELSIAQFIAAGFNVFRVIDLPTLPFVDSTGQNVWWSSFDIIFTHKDVFTTSTGVVSDFNSGIYRV